MTEYNVFSDFLWGRPAAKEDQQRRVDGDGVLRSGRRRRVEEWTATALRDGWQRKNVGLQTPRDWGRREENDDGCSFVFLVLVFFFCFFKDAGFFFFLKFF
jgi:hypothetical protein